MPMDAKAFFLLSEQDATKVSFNLTDAKGVFGAFNAKRISPKAMKGAPKAVQGKFFGFNKGNLSKGMKSQMASQGIKPGQVHAPRARGIKRLWSRDEDALSFFKRKGVVSGNTRLNRKNNQFLNAVVKQHELAETRVRPTSRPFASHLSPAVILQEHNALVTAPKQFDSAKQVMRDLRTAKSPLDMNAPNEAGQLQEAFPWFRYGEGGRLSRGQIRNMTRIFEQRGQ